ncbi:MAG: PIN domain-containing protein [Deltaproteobacteria bacterium]|nr:PIN domain-containing protein [Deltaproteobacteria bacterium]
MTYVETSVVLAQLLAEDRSPPASLWADAIVSSRLTEYEVWNRIHAYGLGSSHGESVRLLLGRLRWLEMTPIVLARALDPWPVRMRTLDALHLASIEFLRAHGQEVKLASYDGRVINAARQLSIPLFTL